MSVEDGTRGACPLLPRSGGGRGPPPPRPTAASAIEPAAGAAATPAAGRTAVPRQNRIVITFLRLCSSGQEHARGLPTWHISSRPRVSPVPRPSHPSPFPPVQPPPPTTAPSSPPPPLPASFRYGGRAALRAPPALAPRGSPRSRRPRRRQPCTLVSRVALPVALSPPHRCRNGAHRCGPAPLMSAHPRRRPLRAPYGPPSRCRRGRRCRRPRPACRAARAALAAATAAAAAARAGSCPSARSRPPLGVPLWAAASRGGAVAAVSAAAAPAARAGRPAGCGAALVGRGGVGEGREGGGGGSSAPPGCSFCRPPPPLAAVTRVRVDRGSKPLLVDAAATLSYRSFPPPLPSLPFPPPPRRRTRRLSPSILFSSPTWAARRRGSLCFSIPPFSAPLPSWRLLRLPVAVAWQSPAPSGPVTVGSASTTGVGVWGGERRGGAGLLRGDRWWWTRVHRRAVGTR